MTLATQVAAHLLKLGELYRRAMVAEASMARAICRRDLKAATKASFRATDLVDQANRLEREVVVMVRDAEVKGSASLMRRALERALGQLDGLRGEITSNWHGDADLISEMQLAFDAARTECPCLDGEAEYASWVVH